MLTIKGYGTLCNSPLALLRADGPEAPASLRPEGPALCRSVRWPRTRFPLPRRLPSRPSSYLSPLFPRRPYCPRALRQGLACHSLPLGLERRNLGSLGYPCRHRELWPFRKQGWGHQKGAPRGYFSAIGPYMSRGPCESCGSMGCPMAPCMSHGATFSLRVLTVWCHGPSSISPFL